MKTSNGSGPRDRWARLRFAIIGPLLAAPPAAGQLAQALQALAARTWRHPVTGADIHFGASTIERWYYAARRAPDPVAHLRDRLRGNGQRFACVSPAVAQALQQQYTEHPGWTIQLHVDNLRAAFRGSDTYVPSYPSIRRYLLAHAMFRQARPKRASAAALAARDRLERLEVRSFELEHTGALWHLDFHHGSRKIVTAGGQWQTPMLLGVIDDHSRLACHLQWYLDETAASLIHGLSQAFMKRGLPRALMTDNGAAMVAEETAGGLARLGILHQTTLPYSPYQNAKQEAFWGRVEGRLMALLEGCESLTLEALNLATQAWVEQEYHRNRHSEIDATPLERFLNAPCVLRPCPEADVLRAAFRIDVVRRQRRSDGTVSLAGRRFEIPAQYRHLQEVCLRYARWDLASVDLIDPRTDTVLCAVRPLDKSANASGVRRRLAPPAQGAPASPPAADTPALLAQLLAEYAATGLPPAYLPTTDEAPSS